MTTVSKFRIVPDLGNTTSPGADTYFTIVADVRKTPSPGADTYFKTHQFEYQSMRMGQAMAILGASYLRHGGMLLERVGSRLPTLRPQKPRTTVDGQSIDVPLRPVVEHQDRAALTAHVAQSLALDPPATETLFELLANHWIDDTQFDSSFETILSHPAARWLIAIGRPLVPFALGRVDAEPEHWSYVLAQITGAQPIAPDALREDAVTMSEQHR